MNIFTRPYKIQLEVTNRCNLNCRMCPRTNLGLEYKDMDLSVLECILTKIHPPMEISLTGWGEPLLHPDIFKIIALCKAKFFTTRMTSNGVLISQDVAERLAQSSIDSITISVDSFGALADTDFRHRCQNIAENIKCLIQARAQKKSLQIILQATLHKGKEDDVLEVIKNGKAIGVDKINIARLDTRFNHELTILGIKEEQELVKKIIALSNKLKMRIDMPPFIAFVDGRRFFYIVLCKFFQRINRLCPKVYHYLYITHTGKVTPCCGLPNYVVGDILTSSLEEIWHNQALKEFRKKQLSVCAGCETLTYPR